MIIRNKKDVDWLYALFLGRIPENNFVREENMGRPVVDLVKAMIESEEFEREILERFTAYDVLPHRDLSLQILADVLQLIADAELAPPHEGLAPGTWKEGLRRVLAAPPWRQILEARYGMAGRDLIDRLGGTLLVEQPNAAVGEGEPAAPAPRSGIVAGVEIIADTICRGWVVDRDDPAALLHLKVKVNGSTAKIIAADEFRRDVQQLYGGEGRAGFTVRLDRLPDVAWSNRAAIEIIEVSQGATVLAEHIVETRATWVLRMQAELSEALAWVRKTLDRLQISGETERLNRVKRLFQARPFGGDPTPVTHELTDLLDALSRLEQWVPRLEQRQCWALPFYSVVRPILQLVVSPPFLDGSVSLSIVVIDDPGEPGKAAVTLASVLAQTQRPAEIFLIATADARVERASDIETLGIVRLLGDQSPENAVNDLAGRITCSHLIILDAGVALAPEALAWFAAAAASTGAVVYTDEELLSHDADWGKRFQPLFKPAFDYDLILQRNYIGDTFCIKRQVYLDLAGLTSDIALDARHDLLLRAVAQFGRDSVTHLPLVLVSRPAKTRAECLETARDRTLCTVQRYLDRMATHAKAIAHEDPVGRTVEDAVKILWRDDPMSLISVVVPTEAGVDMVFTLISSLRRHADNWDRVEIVVIVNGDIDARLRLGFSELERAFDHTRIIYYRRAAFNWCEINNAAVESAAEDGVFVFLNDDMVCLTSGWDTRLRSQLARAEVGVVGGRLLYPNGAIQHVGIAFCQDGTTAHEAMGDAADDGLYLDRTLLVHEVGAVTGAFLACRRALFEDVGGFDAQRYAITSGDADFCVRVRNTGRSVIYDPYLTWIHYESVSRGQDAHDYRKQWRAAAEHGRWRSRFSAEELVDLSNNPHVSLGQRPFEVFHKPSGEGVELWLEAQRSRRDRWRAASGRPNHSPG